MSGAERAGWLAAIVGDENTIASALSQPKWAEVLDARKLTTRQAVATALVKLFMWHMSQPLAYLWVLAVYSCDLQTG